MPARGGQTAAAAAPAGPAEASFTMSVPGPRRSPGQLTAAGPGGGIGPAPQRLAGGLRDLAPPRDPHAGARSRRPGARGLPGLGTTRRVPGRPCRRPLREPAFFRLVVTGGAHGNTTYHTFLWVRGPVGWHEATLGDLLLPDADARQRLSDAFTGPAARGQGRLGDGRIGRAALRGAPRRLYPGADRPDRALCALRGGGLTRREALMWRSLPTASTGYSGPRFSRCCANG